MPADTSQQPVRVILPEELEKQMRASAKRKPGKKEVDPNRPMYKTKCDECEIPIEVPFVPDGTRPVLCQDCLPEYRSRMAKMEEQKRAEQGMLTPRPPVQSPSKANVRTSAHSPIRTAAPRGMVSQKQSSTGQGSVIRPGQTVQF
jgi:CxxC-x17-CxxC domain-containing protein